MGHDPANAAYAQLFELSPFPAVVSRLDDHRVLAVNRSAVDVVGVRPADAIGQPVSGYYVDPVQRLELVDRVRRDGRADNVRLNIKRANGAPYAYVLPANQYDAGLTAELLQVLRIGGVEIEQAESAFTAGGVTFSAGAFVIRLG